MIKNSVSHNWKPQEKTVKKFVVQSGLFLVGRAMEAAAVLDKDVRSEVAGWKDPFTFLFKVLPNGPCMVMKKQGGVLRYAGADPVEADLTVFFKNIEAAFLVFSAQIGSPQGYAEHRMALKGDASQAMSIIRCMEITQAYLFPKILASRALKRVPPMTLKRAGIRAAMYGLGIPLGMGKFAKFVGK